MELKNQSTSATWLLMALALSLMHSVSSIGCFVCTSINHSQPTCEDRFNNTDEYYQPTCWAYRRDRVGKFPASECIKMTAKDRQTGKSYVVRSCVVDDGGPNSETEIGRESHCGWMKVIEFENRRMDGCIMSCNTNGCNGGSNTYHLPTSAKELMFSLCLFVVLTLKF